MSPVTVAGLCAQALAEALSGMAYLQLVRPGSPVVLGTFASSMSMATGAPTFGTPEAAQAVFVMAALARRCGVPFRSGGQLTASKALDAQAAYESAHTLLPTVQAGVNFVLHAAGWLEGGLTLGYEKLITDADQLGAMEVHARGVDLSDNGQAMEAFRTNAHGDHFLGNAHTLANFENAFWRSEMAEQQQLRAVVGGGLAHRGTAGPTPAGRSFWPTTSRPPSTTPSTPSCKTSSPAAKPRSPARPSKRRTHRLRQRPRKAMSTADI